MAGLLSEPNALVCSIRQPLRPSKGSVGQQERLTTHCPRGARFINSPAGAAAFAGPPTEDQGSARKIDWQGFEARLRQHSVDTGHIVFGTDTRVAARSREERGRGGDSAALIACDCKRSDVVSASGQGMAFPGSICDVTSSHDTPREGKGRRS